MAANGMRNLSEYSGSGKAVQWTNVFLYSNVNRLRKTWFWRKTTCAQMYICRDIIITGICHLSGHWIAPFGFIQVGFMDQLSLNPEEVFTINREVLTFKTDLSWWIFCQSGHILAAISSQTKNFSASFFGCNPKELCLAFQGLATSEASSNRQPSNNTFECDSSSTLLWALILLRFIMWMLKESFSCTAYTKSAR